MRVLHIITSLRIGGAEHLLVELLPRLRQRGIDVELLLFDGTRTSFYEQLKHRGIQIYSLGKGIQAMHNPLLIFKLRKFLKKRYDVIHTHNTPCQLLTAIAGWKCPSLLVTTEHNTFNRRRAWSWYRHIDRWMYDKYAQIICVSEQVRHHLSESLGSPGLKNRIRTITNGVDIERIACASPDSALQMQYSAKKIVLMVSAFRAQKDHKTLITAMNFLPKEYHLLLVGDGELRKETESFVQAQHLTDHIHFLGNRADVPALLKAADVVVMSSHYEGLSLSSVEGLASGKPFIASDVNGLREIVGGAGLLFPLGDANRLAGLIREVCEDTHLRNQIAERCTLRAAPYDVHRMVEGYERIYRQIRP